MKSIRNKRMKASRLNYLKGVNSGSDLSKKQIIELFTYIDMLEDLLNEDDEDDVHGTQGWRYYLDIED